MNIIHQTQPEQDQCASACIAMILNKPVDEVVAEFHKPFWDGEVEISEYLIRNGCRVEIPPSVIPGGSALWDKDKAYIFCVPSLNYPGLNHAIVVYYDEHDNYRIADPAMGTERNYYIEHYQDVVRENEYRMRSYICTHIITLPEKKSGFKPVVVDGGSIGQKQAAEIISFVRPEYGDSSEDHFQ